MSVCRTNRIIVLFIAIARLRYFMTVFHVRWLDAGCTVGPAPHWHTYQMVGRVKIPTVHIDVQGVEWADSRPHAGVLGSIFVERIQHGLETTEGHFVSMKTI